MAEALPLDEQQSPLPSILQQCVFEDNIFRKLQAVDILISALDDDMLKKIKGIKMKNWLHTNFINNVEFMRQLRLHSKVGEHPETSIEYYGQDFLTHPEFVFDAKFVETLTDLDKKLNHFIGKLLKEFSKTEDITL